ncbi:MAG: hypothetical protein ACO3EY_03610 [Candidatus Nanopelagicales bacterium]
MVLRFVAKEKGYVIRDLTIKDYYDIKTNFVVNNMEDKYALFSKLSKCPIEDVKTIPGEYWIELWAQLEVMITNSLLKDLNVINKFTHNDVKYGLVNFDEMTIGEFADLDLILTSEQADSKIHEVLAILYRPIVKTTLLSYEIEPYEFKSFKERCQIFLDLPVKYGKSAISFFLCFGLASTGLTQTYLALPKKKFKKIVEETEKTMQFPGTESSLTLQIKTLLNSVGQLDSGLENLLTTLLGDIMKTEEKSKTTKPGSKEYKKVA